MASFRKSGKKWVAEIRRKKNNYYKSKTFFTKKEAEHWARKIETELDFAKEHRLCEIKTLGEAVKKFIKEVSPTRKGGKQEISVGNVISRYPIYHVLLKDICVEDLRDYLIARPLDGVENSTANKEMNFIRSVLRVARKEWKWLTHNPCVDLEKLKEPKPRNRRPSNEEVAQIVEGLHYSEDKPIKMKMQQIAVVYLIAIETAMRMGEILTLEWNQVYLDKGYLELKNTKNGDDRLVALTKEARRLFKRMIGINKVKVFTVGASSLDTMFRKVMKRKNIKGLQFRDSRKEGTARIAKKLPVMDLAKQTGHRDLKILLNVYYHPDIEDIAAMMN